MGTAQNNGRDERKESRTREDMRPEQTTGDSEYNQADDDHQENGDNNDDSSERHIYDQNRNLNLDNDMDKVEEVERILASDRENSDQMILVNDSNPKQQRDSPILSLSSSNCTNVTTASVSVADVSSNSSNKQIMHIEDERIEASFTRASNEKHMKELIFAQHLGEELSLKDHRGQQLLNHAQQDDDSIKINISDISNVKQQNTTSKNDHLDRLDFETKTNDNARMLEHLDCELDRMLPHDRDNMATAVHQTVHLNEQSTQEAPSGIVREFGRRMSVIPQLLSRRLSKHNDYNQNQRRPRFSLQTQCSSPVGSLPDPQPTTVAGVGGTITTVTRSKRKTAPLPRLVGKNGQVNLFLDNIDRRQYVRDLFTTMIDIKWRYNLMAAAFGFVFSWLFFACVWYIVLYVHNDLEHENDPNWSPCIVNVHSFPAALLFSIETQSTLGFGSRIISVECPGAIVIFCIQLIFGVVVECLIVGMVFAKLSRPAKRSQTIMYSKYATVCLREGKMCLMFRVGDVRSKSHIIGATIRASLVSQKVTEEGETIPFYHYQLKVKIDDSKNSLLLIWPVTIVHLIDESSPFYKLSSEELANFKFEIITVLEGTVESTGQAIQVRSSYLPSEVKWGYRFEPIVSTHGYGRYAQTIIDYNKFNQVLRVDTPNCSPMEYYAKRETPGSIHDTCSR